MIGQSPPLQHFTANCAPGYIVILAQWDSFGPILVTSPLPWLCLSNTSENSKETTGSDHLSVLPIVEPYDRSAKEEPFLQQQLANTGPPYPQSHQFGYPLKMAHKNFYIQALQIIMNVMYTLHIPLFLQTYFRNYSNPLYDSLELLVHFRAKKLHSNPPSLGTARSRSPFFLLSILHSGLDYLLTGKGRTKPEAELTSYAHSPVIK